MLANLACIYFCIVIAAITTTIKATVIKLRFDIFSYDMGFHAY